MAVQYMSIVLDWTYLEMLFKAGSTMLRVYVF